MEKKITKKEMILNAALTLFAEKGFTATSIDEIGDAVNMKGPALYHYFKGKDAILESLMEMVGAHYDRNFGSKEHMGNLPENMDELLAMTNKRLEFTIHDPQIKKVRRMLNMEQFRNEKLARAASLHFSEALESLYTVIFEQMIAAGSLKAYDPKLLAFEFTAPVTIMVHMIDREPEREAEAMERIKAHLEHFKEIYGKEV